MPWKVLRGNACGSLGQIYPEKFTIISISVCQSAFNQIINSQGQMYWKLKENSACT